MEKRVLGKTGRVVSVLGLGGFHLLELSDKDAVRLMETFLDEGGNYMETAAQYYTATNRTVGVLVSPPGEEDEASEEAVTITEEVGG